MRQEVPHDLVAPHPCRKPSKPRECRVGVRVIAESLQPAVHTVGVRPIALDAHGAEILLDDQASGEGGTLEVELVRPVRCLSDEDKAGVADHVHQRIKVRLPSMQDFNGAGNFGDGRGGSGGSGSARMQHDQRCLACAAPCWTSVRLAGPQFAFTAQAAPGFRPRVLLTSA